MPAEAATGLPSGRVTALRLALDTTDRHALLVERDATIGARVTLVHAATDLRDPLHHLLRRHLVVHAADAALRFAEGSDVVAIPPAGRVDVTLGLDAIPLASIDLDGAPRLLAAYALSPLETRYLADNGHPHAVPSGARAATSTPTTDLHTHFAGCLHPEALVELGARLGVRYPAARLEEAGVRVDGRADVGLDELAPGLRRALARRLALPLDRQSTFGEMERVYRLRAPITKARAAFLPICEAIARDYAAMGVRYAELSLADVVDSDRLRALHRALPAIEAETGTALRFLAAFNRHDDLEWDLDLIDRVSDLFGSRFLVGVDFMGHETNSTRAFERQLRLLAARASRERPGFVLRVHAGENAAHPENVRVAVEAAASEGVLVRVGHGLHGIDARTLDAVRAAGAVVEFNLNSNFALNNLQTTLAAPIRAYLARGIDVVLGTDGYGVYGTSMAMEARAARLSGLGDEELARVLDAEARYLEARRRFDTGLPAADAFDPPPTAPPRWFTPEVTIRARAADAARDAAVDARLAELGAVVLDAASFGELARGKALISIAGAWKNSWERVSAARREDVARELAALLDALDPASTVVVTGGTRHGVEGLVGPRARDRGMAVVAMIVRETPPDALDEGSFTHALVVGTRPWDKAAGLYLAMREHGGLCLFVGGGPVVSDEIQAASNLRCRYLLMDGPEGASTDHAREQPDRAFRTAEDVLATLRAPAAFASPREPYWHLGPNPTVDLVITRDAPGTGALEVLLVRRDDDAPVEGGKWALPGGFVRTDAPRGTPWREGVESTRAAAVREALEEAAIDLRGREADLVHVGDYAGDGRDPRDTADAWSRTSVFALHLDEATARAPIAGGDDACDARWVDATRLPALAFDHARLVADALAAPGGSVASRAR